MNISHKLFNQNTVNVSYSCMDNMAFIISGHNAKVRNNNTEVITGGKGCNCRKRNQCPLNDAYPTKIIMYKASVSANNLASKFYYGVTEGDFKTRWRNHKTNVNYKNVTELSHYVWEFRDKHDRSSDDSNILWSIEECSSKYKYGTRCCDLCILENDYSNGWEIISFE